MNRSDARELLFRGSSHQRLLAARRIARDPDSEDRSLLRTALAREGDSYVRRVIALALEVVEQEDAGPSLADPDDTEPLGSDFRDALDMFVHEFRPLLGVLG